MKIYQCCPYYNEKLIANININEASKWIDEFHIVEANRSYQNKKRDYDFELMFGPNAKVKYHKLDVNNKYVSSSIWGKLKLIKYRFCKNEYRRNVLRNPAWYNETFQRNMWNEELELKDDDIIILSDIDEIIDSRFSDKIIEKVYEHQIITIPIYFTLFYLNLFSRNWGGAPNYSYRVFIMTGKKFNTLGITLDELRKLGEQGKLTEEIYCLNEFAGFHHSWLGDEKFILNKLNSYSHLEHQKFTNIKYIKECLKENKSIFPGHELEINNEIKQLLSVEEIRERNLIKYFL